jgi:ABC-2 type transport system ATP-binding protein
VDLAGDQHRRMGGYSRGMRQRMRLAATLVHSPEVLLLDEPLSGTDPPQRLRFMEAMRGLVAQGRTIVISSHILEEVETLADRIILLTAGKVAATGEYRAIRQKLNERPYVVRVETDQPRVLGAGLMAIDAVVSVEVDEEGRLLVRSREVSELQRALPRVAHEKGVRVLRVEPLDDSLESVFEYLAQQQWKARG